MTISKFYCKVDCMFQSHLGTLTLFLALLIYNNIILYSYYIIDDAMFLFMET